MADFTPPASAQVSTQPTQSLRLSPTVASAHGLDNRGLEAGALPGMGYGRFGRMFPFTGRMLPEACLLDIATAMIKKDFSKPITEAEEVDENPSVPAGYTYFGQFIDHDITLDPTDLKAKSVDVAALEDFRTPALDLDCIYGRGPDDQPYMYEQDGLRLRLGASVTTGSAIKGNANDLLRLVVAGETSARAIIGDKRNDENRIVSQIQALFISFHNKVIETPELIRAVGGDWNDTGSRFRSAVNIVRWHYQWLVVHDYLKRVLEGGIITDILSSGTPNLPNYEKPQANYAYIPVEFAGAAYRFGHSMVRPGYSLNTDVLRDPAAGPPTDPQTEDGRISIFSRSPEGTGNLNGFGVPLPESWGIDWSFYFDHVGLGTGTNGFKLPQPSYRIDAQLVSPLADLPEFFGTTGPLGNLAFRNLVRGSNNLRLPSGEQIAHAFGIIPLSPDVLWGKAGSFRLDASTLGEMQGDIDSTIARRKVVLDKWVNGTGPTGQVLNGNTPLWYYILREAEHFGVDRVQEGPTAAFGGQCLGPIGSRIVAETFIGLLWNDPQSFLRRWPMFAPMAPITATPKTFTLGDLISWVY